MRDSKTWEGWFIVLQCQTERANNSDCFGITAQINLKLSNDGEICFASTSICNIRCQWGENLVQFVQLINFNLLKLCHPQKI